MLLGVHNPVELLGDKLLESIGGGVCFWNYNLMWSRFISFNKHLSGIYVYKSNLAGGKYL